MKNLALFLVVIVCLYSASCKKSSPTDTKLNLLTGPVWASDSLLTNGVDASGPTGLLKNFKGDAKFNKDGTGSFGVYTGTWRFTANETQIVIVTDSLAFPLTTTIAELTSISLKITTSLPNILNPASPTNIRMTFKAR